MSGITANRDGMTASKRVHELRLFRDRLREFAAGELTSKNGRESLDHYIDEFEVYFHDVCKWNARRLVGATDLWNELAYLADQCATHRVLYGSRTFDHLISLRELAKTRHSQLINKRGEYNAQKEPK